MREEKDEPLTTRSADGSRRTGHIRLQFRKNRILRRTRSADPRMEHSPEGGQSPTRIRRMGMGQKYYHVSGNEPTRSYRFWSSKPALVMFGFLALALQRQEIRFLGGAVLVFLFQVSLVVGTWSRFIVGHPLVRECSETTFRCYQYSLRQVERLCDPKDRSRKLAVGMAYYCSSTTTEFAGDYLRQRRAQVTQKALAELERVKRRLCQSAP